MSVSGYFLTTVLGPVTAYLAMCAATTGDLDESVALFEESESAPPVGAIVALVLATTPGSASRPSVGACPVWSRHPRPGH